MITLMTGLPGNGKTLFALWYIKSKADNETREVFYHNINILDRGALPWTEFDPEKWMDLPYGSMIVIDEAQDIFSKKPNGSKLPDFYSELAKHRHKGFDIFLITQHPTLIDNFPRQLVGQHFHSVRKFGLSRSTIYEWSAANPSPQSAASQKSAVTLKFAYPKAVYSWYKSAEVHTVKRAIPAKLILAALFVVLVAAAGWYALDRYQSRGKRLAEQSGLSGVPGSAGPGRGVLPTGESGKSSKLEFDPVQDAKYFAWSSSPRVVGLQQSAPKYDELTKPVRVPVPAACIQRGSVKSKKEITCKCFSQQGTPLAVEFNMCIDFAQNGFFQDFNPDGNDARKDGSSVSGGVSGGVQVASVPQVSVLPNLVEPARAEAHPIAK